MKTILATAAALSFTTALALAQTPDFAAVDADASGTITVEEAKAAMPELTDEAFAAADADGSGDLSAEEYAALAG